MRRLGFVFTLFCLFLAACAAPPADVPAASPGPATRTATPSATASPLLGLTPETPTPETPTITPLPTIPTFTPTFDVRTIATATPAPKAECPNPNYHLQIELPQVENFSPTALEPWTKLDTIIVNYLNSGGQIENLRAAYQKRRADKLYGGFLPVSIETTGDGVPEIIVFNPISDTEQFSFAIYVFGCERGMYKKVFVFQQSGSTENYQNLIVQDVNSDEIPELIIQAGHNYPEPSSRIWVYGYLNDSYRSLLSIPYLSDLNTLDYDRWLKPTYEIKFKEYIAAFGDYKFEIRPKSKNGTYELVLTWNLEYSGGPSRTANYIYVWDGENFSQARVKYPKPEYRFQATQGGDKATHSGEYDQAINLYQSAIFDNKLKWYSPKRQATFDHPWTTLTPIPVSFIDPTEYPRLAAYAYYRMVILHTLLGETEAAQVKYATLQEKFPAGSPGHPYVEMATGFWNAYQSSGRMYDACAAAIAYADAHPEILIPLGSGYHGWQSHQYQPADVCPFR